MDFKGWFRLGDGTRCDPLTVTDTFSRYLLCCKAGTAMGDAVSTDVWATLTRIFREYGMPAAIRVDNGQPVGSSEGPSRPDQARSEDHQGRRHARAHRARKAAAERPPREIPSDAAAGDDAPHLDEHASSAASDSTRFSASTTNSALTKRLRQRPPAALYVSFTQDRLPTRINEPEYPSWYEVLTPSPGVTSPSVAREYFLSGALYGERVGLVEIEEDCFEVYFHKVLLGRDPHRHPELGLIAA